MSEEIIEHARMLEVAWTKAEGTPEESEAEQRFSDYCQLLTYAAMFTIQNTERGRPG